MKAGHVSVLVGGSRGIGRALARQLAARGGDVIVVGRDAERLASALRELQEVWPDGRHAALRLDISDPDDMQALAAECEQRYGRVDLLVVSALVAGYEGLPPATRDLSLAEWQRSIDVNLNGVFLANRALLPLMLARGDGEIVNICSSTTPHGLSGRALAPAYSASKFAVAEFSRLLASDLADEGIRVHALFPGPVETPLIENTVLSANFGGRIDADNFAVAVLDLLSASRDAAVVDAHILPMRTPDQPAVRAVS
ncbi:MAG TPA: SDR family oxidoreductase [Propylenella sp.]|nr:SDR family oxidoreductase [Propylenella sp.]